jgi:hypothetical protein
VEGAMAVMGSKAPVDRLERFVRRGRHGRSLFRSGGPSYSALLR